MAQRNAKKNQGRGSGTRQGTGCLVWLALVILVFFIFLLNKDTILRVIGNSKFRDALNANTVTNSGEGKKPDRDTDNRIVADGKPEPKPAEPAPRKEAEPVKTPEKTSGTTVRTGEDKPADAKPDTVKPDTAKPEVKPRSEDPPPGQALRKVSLYFVKVDDDGTIVRKDVKRSVKGTDSPLKDSLSSLFRGLSDEELRQGLVSLIPLGTKLLSVSLRGTTAIVSLSEEFMFNSLGIEGYSGQLKQIVWTATEFPTVKDVQILIEGRQVDYLGGEGVYIGRPLSRNSF